MSTILGVRAFNRSQKFSIGDKAASPTHTALVNVDNKRVQRDIARHSAIGALLQVTAPFYQNDDGTVELGGKVSVSGVTASTTAVNATRASGALVSQPADMVALATPVATPRVDLVALDTVTPDIVKVDGTATAGANATNLTGKPDVPANRIALAYVAWPAAVPATATNATAGTNDVVSYASHGFTNGQQVVLVTATGGAGLTAGNVYYVRDVTAGTFKLAATLGGAAVDITTAYTALQFATSPTVVDARP